MVQRSQRSLAAMLLIQRLVEVAAKPLASAEYWRLLESVGDPERLLGRSASDLTSTHGLNPILAERVATLLDAATAFAFALDEAEQAGIHVIASVDEEYPNRLRDRLGRAAPALLYLAGDPSLLAMDLLGIVGSRSVTDAGIEVAQQAARAAVQNRVGLVSGAARGVDQVAMDAALDAEGIVIGVCADSLARAVRARRSRQAILDGRLLLCSPYRPTAGFTAATAMARNKIIYGLSRATLVVAAEVDRGGTWSGATESIRQRICPVLVWRGPGGGTGNAQLESLGASPVASLDELFPLVDEGRRLPEQLSLHM